ncbi:hypothetical protein CEXT_548621 [Caerostris extrusa]|uniref:Uncharacterized protein n=1 Tax=Caerostris extrusa TaxID=172846 RepID=A0AAV4XPK9_CAEEX|nr:hypothetical protein CEXT_548621 [Caerostris extrusa]
MNYLFSLSWEHKPTTQRDTSTLLVPASSLLFSPINLANLLFSPINLADLIFSPPLPNGPRTPFVSYRDYSSHHGISKKTESAPQKRMNVRYSAKYYRLLTNFNVFSSYVHGSELSGFKQKLEQSRGLLSVRTDNTERIEADNFRFGAENGHCKSVNYKIISLNLRKKISSHISTTLQGVRPLYRAIKQTQDNLRFPEESCSHETPDEESCSYVTPGEESCSYVTAGEGSCSYETPGEESCSHEAPGEESVIDSPAQKKRWWFRRSSAGKTGSADSGRSAPLPYNRPSRHSGQNRTERARNQGDGGHVLVLFTCHYYINICITIIDKCNKGMKNSQWSSPGVLKDLQNFDYDISLLTSLKLPRCVLINNALAISFFPENRWLLSPSAPFFKIKGYFRLGSGGLKRWFRFLTGFSLSLAPHVIFIFVP